MRKGTERGGQEEGKRETEKPSMKYSNQSSFLN